MARTAAAILSSSATTLPREGRIEMWGLKLSIFFSHSSPKPVITLLTIMTAATPSMTPRIETQVMTDATERFGLRYLVAKKTEKLTTDP